MRTRKMARLLVGIALAALCSFPKSGQAAEAYFNEDFGGPAPGSSIRDYTDAWQIANGALDHVGPGRSYIRSVFSDYNERDFVFEITFSTIDYICLIGIGEGGLGDPPDAPINSV